MSRDWATELVAKWCDHCADEMRPRIQRARNAYKTGPLVEPVKEFAALLEQQQHDWVELAKKLRAQE